MVSVYLLSVRRHLLVFDWFNLLLRRFSPNDLRLIGVKQKRLLLEATHRAAHQELLLAQLPLNTHEKGLVLPFGVFVDCGDHCLIALREVN